MPKWGWWVAAFLLFMFSSSHSMVHGYWFAGWWRTVMHRPLGDWHSIDLVPFIGAYVAAHILAQAIAFYRELETDGTSHDKSEPPGK